MRACVSRRDLEWSKLYNVVQEECRQRLAISEAEINNLRLGVTKAERERETAEGELSAAKLRLERAEAAITQERRVAAAEAAASNAAAQNDHAVAESRLADLRRIADAADERAEAAEKRAAAAAHRAAQAEAALAVTESAVQTGKAASDANAAKAVSAEANLADVQQRATRDAHAVAALQAEARPKREDPHLIEEAWHRFPLLRHDCP